MINHYKNISYILFWNGPICTMATLTFGNLSTFLMLILVYFYLSNILQDFFLLESIPTLWYFYLYSRTRSVYPSAAVFRIWIGLLIVPEVTIWFVLVPRGCVRADQWGKSMPPTRHVTPPTPPYVLFLYISASLTLYSYIARNGACCRLFIRPLHRASHFSNEK